ncbi:hypothetical protein ASV53_21915, partial [Photobacterium sanguinicancri]
MGEILDTVKVKSYDLDGVRADIPLLFLDGVPLFIVNAYLFHKARSNNDITVSSRKSQISLFLHQVLTDHNEWRNEKDVQTKHVLANKAVFKVNDSYVNAFLNNLFIGECQFSSKYKQGGLKNSSMSQHIEAITDFYSFCYTYGFTAKKFDFSYSYNKHTKKVVAKLGLNFDIINRYYR